MSAASGSTADVGVRAAPANAAGVHRRVEHLMGMPISLAMRGLHAADGAADVAWQRALEVLQEADRVFSTYRADSCITRLDRGDIGLTDCPPEVAEVLALGERARVESGGAFDVRRPDAAGVVHLDPSGVVKGWAVDRAAEHLHALQDTDFCLSAGGDMVCHTTTDAPPWRVGIEDPFDPGRVVAVVPIGRGAVATSGFARRGAHITDPRSGRVPTELASVTVIGPDLVWADMDATAAFALDADAPQWLQTRVGRTGLVVWSDGRRTLTGAGQGASTTASS